MTAATSGERAPAIARGAAPVRFAMPVMGTGTRLLAWMVGLNLLFSGLLMAILPAQFSSPAYDSIRAHLTLIGAFFVAAGLLLLFWQLLPLRFIWLPPISLLTAALCLTVVTQGFARSQSWSGVADYGLQSLTLLVACLGAEQRLQRRLQLVTICVFAFVFVLGVLLLAFPSQFRSPTYVHVRPQASLWGAAFIMLAALLAVRLRWSGVRWTRYFVLPVAAAMLAWTYEAFVRTNALPAVVPYALLALALVVESFVPASWLAPPLGSLRNKLIVLPVALVGLSLVIVVARSLHETEDAYMSRARQDLGTSAQLLSDSAGHLVAGQVQLARLVSLQPAIRSMDPQRQLPVIQEAIAVNPDVARIAISGLNGESIIASDARSLPPSDQRTLSPGLNHVLTQHEAATEVIDSPVLGAPALALRLPIIDADGSFGGAFTSLVSLANLNAEIQGIPAGAGTRIIIVDELGRVVVHPTPSLVRARADLSSVPPVAAALRGDYQTVVFQDKRISLVSAQARVPGTGWTVLVQQPEADILAPATLARERAMGFLLVMLLIVIASLVAIARTLSRPLLQLAEAAGRLGNGSYDVQLPEAGSDEIGVLVTAFGGMRDRLQEHMQLLMDQRDETEFERNRLETLLATVNVAIFTTDRTGLVTLLNPAGEALFGVRAPDAVGRPYSELLRLSSASPRYLDRTIETGEPAELSREDGRDGSGAARVYALRTAALRTADGRISGGLEAVLDVTEYTNMERALQSRTTALESKTAEQDAFLYTVSHDLKAPLVSIEGMAEMLSSEAATRLLDDDRFYVTRIIANTQRMSALLEDLLQLSRIGRVNATMEPVALEAVLADVREDLATQIQARGAKLTVVTSLPVVMANRVRLTEALVNLVDNSIKYTPADRSPEIEIGAGSSGDLAECWVQDNGVGIPEAQRDRAFDLFQRLPEGTRLNPTGSGAGLAIVSRIIQVQGGRIWVDSAPGQGTIMRFTLALALEGPQQEAM